MNRGLVILLAALASVRILTAAILWPSLRSPDHPWAWTNNDGYDRIAAIWVETGVYGGAPGIPTATRTPAYPALLAAARILSGGHDSQPLATAIQILLSVATGWTIHRTAPLSHAPLARERWESDMGSRLARWAMTESPRLTAARTMRNVLLAPFLQMTPRSTMALAAFNGPLLLLSFAGLWLAARATPGGFRVMAPIACTLLYFWLLHAVVWPQGRYVLPGLLPFTIFAGHALASLAAWMRLRHALLNSAS